MDTSPKAQTQPEAAPPENKPMPTGGGAKLLRSSSIVGLMTMLSRVLGLARDIVLANIFGTDKTDTFFVAFKIPNFLRRLFAEGAFSVAFVPVLSEYKTQKPKAAVKELVDQVAGSLGAILLLIASLGSICSPLLAMIFAPGFLSIPEKFDLTSDMLRITFPYLFLISMTAFSGGILNTYGRFAIPAFTPVLLNISLISCAVWLVPVMDEPIMALAWGVAIAGAVQLAFQVPFLAQIGLVPKPRLGFKHEGVKRIMTLMVPALFGVSVSQINLLLDTLLASFLQQGSVSWLYYADRLAELPLGVFGIAIASVILPSLSQKHASSSPEQFSATLDWALRMVLLLGLPAALALIIIAEPVLTTLFYSNKVTEFDIAMSAASLKAYGFGLVAFMLIKVLATGFYSRQDTKTPVKIGIIAMVANMVFNLMLVFWLDHVGLALATMLSAYVNMGLLLRGLLKQGAYRVGQGWSVFGLRLILANAALVGLLLLLPDAQQWFEWSTWQRIGVLGLVVASGLLVYAAVLFALGLRPRDFKVRKTV